MRDSLEKSTFNYLSKSIYKVETNKPVSHWVSKILCIKYFKNFSFSKISKIEFSLALKIESLTNSKQQLNWLMEHYDFGYNHTGIQNTSKFFFNKQLNQLNRTELATLVIMTRNPNFYNPLKRPEKVNQKLRILLKE